MGTGISGFLLRQKATYPRPHWFIPVPAASPVGLLLLPQLNDKINK